MKYLETEIRKMEETDLPMVMEIEDLCFINPWKRSDFLYEMYENDYSNLWVIELSNSSLGLKSVVGFADFWFTFDSATICQIAIHPELQGNKLGSELLDEIIKEAYVKKIKNITLEVRRSNEKAIKLYEKYGFIVSHVKEGYYSDGEDALYMIREGTNG